MLISEHRQAVVDSCQKIASLNLTPGTTGNVSSLDKDSGLIAISPSGLDYEEMSQEDVAVLNNRGEIVAGNYKPSSEWPLHLACYLSRPDIAGIVHTHSIYTTTFACLGMDIEAVHYMVGFAGYKVPCLRYARPGSEELADITVEGIAEYDAVLLANHGLLAVGKTLKSAFATAEQVEFTAEIYYKAKNIGEPNIISKEEMKHIRKKLHVYGKEEE